MYALATELICVSVSNILGSTFWYLNIKNVAFGAHFIDALQTSKIKTWLYPAESLSKNIILTKDKVDVYKRQP